MANAALLGNVDVCRRGGPHPSDWTVEVLPWPTSSLCLGGAPG